MIQVHSFFIKVSKIQSIFSIAKKFTQIFCRATLQKFGSLFYPNDKNENTLWILVEFNAHWLSTEVFEYLTFILLKMILLIPIIGKY